MALAFPLTLAALSAGADVAARSSPVIVTVDAATPVRVQIALSPHEVLPCDSSDNAIVFDGMVDPRAGLALNIDAGPLCIRHTYDNFPDGDWGTSQLWIRRYDATLRIGLRARAP